MRIAVLFLMFLSVSFLGAASSDEQQIRDVEKAWASAVVAKDFAALDRMLMPDLIYAHSTGIIDDKAKYLEKMRAGKQVYAAIDQNSITVRLHGNAAVAHSQIQMRGHNDDGPFNDRLMAMHFWVKSNGKWLLAAHQTTKLK
jgi:ketosteroid isomerase-like protein